MKSLFLSLFLSVPAYALDPHVEAVARIVEAARGKVERTADGLGLKLVDLAVPNAGPHDHRKDDPYDAAFFEHLGQLTTLESLNVIATKANDEWIAPLGQLTNLKTLRFTNNGKLTDAGMEKLAALKNLESFSFVGTAITGKAYAKCADWTKVIKVSHRGSSIDDEGLKALCEHLPNLESISLAHAKFTDAGAVHLAKLTQLKGLEIGTKNATPACLANLKSLPLEYLQLGDGLDAPAGIAACKGIGTLKRLTLTHCEHLSDEGVKLATELRQLIQLEIGGLVLPDERLPLLAGFAFLKELKLINRPKGYPPETQAKIKALLPKVDVKWQ
jgi:Leucine Rich repeat